MSSNPGVIISHRSRAIAVKVIRGHFATGYSHVNYYIDLTHAKDRHSMAKEIAVELSGRYANISIDTIICMDGTETIGAFLADALSQQGIGLINSGSDIYVITPELDSGRHFLFRESCLDMVRDKQILMLVSSVSTGQTVNRAMECLRYYGGILAGICALFSIVPEIYGYPVNAVFSNEDIPDYRSYPSENCAMCAERQKIDGVVNAFGYSSL